MGPIAVRRFKIMRWIALRSQRLISQHLGDQLIVKHTTPDPVDLPAETARCIIALNMPLAEIPRAITRIYHALGPVRLIGAQRM